MSLKIPKPVTALTLVFSLFLLIGCLPEAGGPRQELAVELSPAYSRPAVTHQGPPLYCKAGRGIIKFSHDWDEFPDTLFMLYPGERINVPFPSMHASEKATIQSYFDREGQRIIFCPFVDGPPGQRIACASLYVLDEDLQAGLKRTFDIPQMLRGGAISCAYQQTKLKNLLSYGAN